VTVIPRLELLSVAKAFDGVPALVDGRLEVGPGEIHGLVGENGAGKSTLMRIVAGALRPDGGSMRLDGADYAPRAPRAAFAAGVHLVHQELMLVDELSVAENLFLGREPCRGPLVDRPAMRARTAAILGRLGLAADPDTRLGDLALGERQLVEVGRALTQSLRVLIMDEPSASLTGREIERLFAVVRGLRETGTSVVWISHRLDEVRELCARVTTMRDGAFVRAERTAAYPVEAIVRDMVGREVRVDRRFAPRQPARRPRLSVRGFGDPGRYADVDLDLHDGEIVGLFGLVGSGRTEFALGLVGAPGPGRGTAVLDGRPYRPEDPGAALAAGLGMSTEDRQRCGIVPDRPVLENITLSALGRFRRAGLLRLGAERAAAEDLRRRLGVRLASLDQPIRTLSGGNQQKALLARLVASGAGVLIVDEPTRGVDVGAKAEIHALLDELARGGAAILCISSDLPELLALADRIGVMRAGRLVGIVPRADAAPDLLMALATGVAEAPS
jgi:rhamnose transport system ATP-binding protein